MRLRHILFTYLISILPAMMFAQSGGMITAGKYVQRFDFLRAARVYERVLKKDTSNLDAKQKLANCYRMMNQPKNAEIWYGQLASTAGSDPMNKFYYAQALRSNEKYEEAKQYYNEYSRLAPSDKRSQEILKGIEFLSQLSKNNQAYTVQALNCNSSSSDFGPYLYKGELLFSSNRNNDVIVRRTDMWTNKPFLDIYRAKVDTITHNADKAVLFSSNKPNGAYHDGPVAVDRSRNEMYVTRSNYIDRPTKSDDKTVNLKIYRMTADSNSGDWMHKLLNDFPYNNDMYSCAHPNISQDGEDLYFSSDMPGGKGGSDIWVCHRDGAIWGTPQNLEAINTAGSEMFPFISDNGILYFSSDGHFGLGGLDIYSVRKDEKGNWGKLANMGVPLNSSMDDFAYWENEQGNGGYFSSNRVGGAGDDDIYMFTKEMVKICGDVIDRDTKAKLAGATVKFFEGNIIRGTVSADEKGGFCFEAEPYKTYRIQGSKQGYVNKDVNLDVKRDTMNVIVPLTKIGGIDLTVLVQDSKNKAAIPGSDVVLINTVTKKEAKRATDERGQTYFTLEPESDYKIIANKELNSDDERYLTNSTNITTKGLKAPLELNAVIELRKEKLGVGIRIENIYYDLNKSFIRPDAVIELDKLVKILQDNPSMEIELSSHTDCRATVKYNMWLSAKRAETAVNYMIRKGISPIRMIAAGYGETRLVNRCECEGNKVVPCTEQEHQENRRTEFKILKF